MNLTNEKSAHENMDSLVETARCVGRLQIINRVLSLLNSQRRGEISLETMADLLVVTLHQEIQANEPIVRASAAS